MTFIECFATVICYVAILLTGFPLNATRFFVLWLCASVLLIGSHL